MTKKKVLPLAIVGAAFIVILLGILFWKINDTTFSDYNNNAVLGSATLPKSSYNQKGFVAGTKSSNTILSINDIKLSGVEDILNTNTQESITASLKCTYTSLKGAFKLILVSGNGKVITLFDSDKQKNGATVTVPFFSGSNIIRLVGKPVQLQNFSATWVNVDHSKLS